MSFALSNPYTPRANSYKGQLHCHTTNSDGAQSPAVVITAYKDAGYDFCALSDHDYFTPDPGVGGILWIPSVEENASTNVLHILTNNVTVQQSSTVAQTIINAVIAAGGIPWLCHPHYTGTPWGAHDVAALTGYYGIEISNQVVEVLSGTGNAEDVWDDMLSRGLYTFGIAIDDCHNVTNPLLFNHAWVHVFANSCTLSNIVAALKAGNFYSSTGPTMTIAVSGRTITVTTPAASKIEWIINKGFIARTTLTATSDTYSLIGNENYVRIRITRDADSLMAWSNPITGLRWKLPQPGRCGGNAGMR